MLLTTTNLPAHSSVYRASITATLSCLAGALILLWSLYYAGLTIEYQSIKSQLQFESDELQDIYDSEGIEGLIEAVSFEDHREWTSEDAHLVFDDEDFILSVYQQDNFIAGYAELSPYDVEETNLAVLGVINDDEFDELPIFMQRSSLSTEIDITLGKFVPEIWAWRKEYLNVITATLLIMLLPLSLVTASLISRKVNRDIERLSAVLANIGQASIQDRLPINQKPNEFDRLAEHINRMLNRIGQLTQNMEYNSASIAHDLKTPISNVAGRLQLMERDVDKPESIQAHIDKAQENIDSLLRTLDALLRLGEVEAGKRRQAFKPINLSNLAEDIAESFQPVLEEADKHFTYTVEPGIWVQGDTDLLVQLLSNLLENTVEHTRDGASIETVITASAGSIDIQVTDDGPGMTAQDAERIFDRFHRADASRNTPGNGLGLSLVRAIAELHGGSAKILSVNNGSTFLISLPLAAKG